MFEVILTYRDFTEHPVGKYQTLEEAQTVAQRLSAQCKEQAVRAWVRQIRAAKTNLP